MTAAHTRVKECQIRRRYFFVNIVDFPVFGRNKEIQLISQFALRISFNPISAERVVHHIANNPVGCKQLSSRRNIGFFNCSFIDVNNFVVLLRNVILVHPANDFDLTVCLDFAVFRVHFIVNAEINLINIVNKAIYNTVFVCKRDCQKQFGIVIRFFKQVWQYIVKLITLLNKEHTEQLIQFVLVL